MNSIDYYVTLLEDRPRISMVLRAIARAVRPGDVVVEIGSGIGTYALAALRAGAARVHAIDQNPVAHAYARELGVEREGAGRIRLIEAAAETVELPERADLVIFEDYGSLGHSPGLRSLLGHVRTRLAKPEARWLPGAVEILLAPVQTPLRTLTERDAGGLPFTPEAFALLRKRSLNDPFTPDLDGSALGAPGASGGRLLPGQELPRRALYTTTVRMARGGDVTGLLGWIRLDLGGSDRIDNPPSIPPPTYPPVALPFEDPLPASEGELLELGLEAIHGPGPRSLLWRWSVRGARGSREGNSMNGCPGDLELLRRGSPDEAPRPGRRLPAIAELCRQMDGKKTVAELARSLYSLYISEFPNEAAAAGFALDVVEKLRGLKGP